MSKLDLLTISIVIVCLAALGYLVYKIVDLMNPPTEPTTSIQDTYADDASTADSTYTNWDDEANAAGDDVDLDDDQVNTTTGDESTTDNSNFDANEMDNSSDEVAETANTATQATSNNSVATYDSSPATSSGGKYMVLAGSYRQRSNADSQVAKLRKLGYTSAEVKLFDKGTFAVVLVDRFSNYGDAKRLVSELSGKGVDALVSEK